MTGAERALLCDQVEAEALAAISTRFRPSLAGALVVALIAELHLADAPPDGVALIEAENVVRRARKAAGQNSMQDRGGR